MRQPKYTEFVLIDAGEVLCPICCRALHADGKQLCDGDTYSKDACDVCGTLPHWVNDRCFTIAELGDTIASKTSRITVTVMEHNLDYARFLIREGKYWQLVSKGSRNKHETEQTKARPTSDRTRGV